jgi:hypothetical protein
LTLAKSTNGVALLRPALIARPNSRSELRSRIWEDRPAS